MTTGEEIFWALARSTLRDINMQHLDLAHGAAVDTVRWCLTGRRRPTHYRQSFLENECPPLLAYLEKLAFNGDAAGWRTLEARIRFHAEVLRDEAIQPCASPWRAAIWHCLPELAAIGQTILGKMDEPRSVAAFEVLLVSRDADANSGNGGDDKGSADKSGSAGTAAKPRPSPRLVLPVIPIVLTEAEKKALGLDKRGPDADAKGDVTSDAKPEAPDGSDGPGGMKRGPR